MLDKTVMFNISRYKTPEDDINSSYPGWRALQHKQEEADLSENNEL